MTPSHAVHDAVVDRRGPGRPWDARMDALVYLGLVALLIASTMNGLTVEWGVSQTEITVRPDQLVLVCLMPVLLLAWGLGRFRIRLMLFEWAVLGFLVSNLVSSILVSPSRSASLKGTVLLGGYAAMYFVVRQILANRREWLPRATNWVCGLGIAQAVYCLVALVLYAFGYVVGGLQIGHLTEGSVAIKGTFWEPNLLGAYLGVIAVFLAVRYLFDSERGAGGIYLAGLFLTGLALPVTVTRAAGGAFIVGLLALALIGWAYRSEILAWRARTSRIALTLACVVLLTVTGMDALVSALSKYPNLLLERWMPISWIPIDDEAVAVAVEVEQPGVTTEAPAPAMVPVPVIEGAITHSSRSSVDGRMDAWVLAIDASRHRPLLGHGTLAGATVIKEGWWYSSLIQALYDTGLAGLSIVLWIHLAAIVYPIRAWLRARRSPMGPSLLGFGIANAVILLTSQFSNPLYVGFPWVFLGVSMGAVTAYSKGSPTPPAG